MAQVPITLSVVRMNIRLSRGKWARIAQESGCKWNTLQRIANEAEYDPRVSEFARIWAWFEAHGLEGTTAPDSGAEPAGA